MAHYVNIIDGMDNATDGDLSNGLNGFLNQAGVLDLTGGHYQVTEKGTPDMSVDVSTGIAFVPNNAFTEFSSDIQYWRTILDASTNLSISSNASGSTRIDLVCIKVDDTIDPGTNGESAASVIIVEGTPGSGTPSTPADHLKLAEITVANGETAITNSEISDTRVQAQIDATKVSTAADAQTITYGATPTIDWANGSTAYITLTGNATFTFSGGESGKTYRLVVKQGGAGSYTITLPASVRVGDIGTPTLSTVVNDVDYLGFVYNGIDSKYDLVGYSLGHT